jgi:lysophospholipase L1-like esterase
MALTASVVLTVGVLFAADLYLHKRAERSAGMNIWGYRGPLVGRKQPGEVRVAVLGGSTAFGYGVPWDQSIPAALERLLRTRLPIGRATSASVVNLAMSNEGAYSFPFTLRDFVFLDYDVVVLYEGYNDLTGTNESVLRHDSPVFRLFGYYPILPMVIEEKRLALMYGDLATAYRAKNGETVTFSPPASHRAAAAALGAAGIVGGALSNQLDRLAKQAEERAGTSIPGSCPAQWRIYCESIGEAIRYALGRGSHVVVATQPYLNDMHREQQEALRALLRVEFHNRAEVSYVDLGEVVDLKDPRVTFDGMHLNDDGNARIARALSGPVAEAIAR